MRVIFILILVTIGLALLRMLVGDVIRVFTKNMSRSPESGKGQTEAAADQAERLVRDPVSGAYMAEESALKAVIDGKLHFFESSETRDAFLKRKSRA